MFVEEVDQLLGGTTAQHGRRKHADLAQACAAYSRIARFRRGQLFILESCQCCAEYLVPSCSSRRVGSPRPPTTCVPTCCAASMKCVPKARLPRWSATKSLTLPLRSMRKTWPSRISLGTT